MCAYMCICLFISYRTAILTLNMHAADEISYTTFMAETRLSVDLETTPSPALKGSLWISFHGDTWLYTYTWKIVLALYCVYKDPISK